MHASAVCILLPPQGSFFNYGAATQRWIAREHRHTRRASPAEALSAACSNPNPAPQAPAPVPEHGEAHVPASAPEVAPGEGQVSHVQKRADLPWLPNQDHDLDVC